MNPKIELLSASQTHWEHLIRVCTEFVGTSPTRILDSKNIKVSDSKAYPIALGSLTSLYSNKNTPPYKMLEVMKHVHFTLVIETDSRLILKSILQFQGIDFTQTINEDVWIASGTLKNWIDFTVYFSQEEIDSKIRLLANFITLFFDTLKMRIFWDRYQRESLRDKTFIMREK